MKKLIKLIENLPDYLDDKYDLDKEGGQGYIEDCQKAIREIKEHVKKLKISP